MRVLVGCEESGVVRRAFEKMGHDAWSNDLIPSRDNAEKHLQMCVTKAIKNYGPWDIIILHPDCSAMALSGNRWYGKGMPMNDRRVSAIMWTEKLWSLAKKFSNVGCALENPMSVIWNHIGKPQYIHPHQFGHGEVKKTGILTDRLPQLIPTNNVSGRVPRVWKMPPGKNRKRDRSETKQGIADAMAEQWGHLA